MSEKPLSPITAAPLEMLINAKNNAVPLFGSFELTPRCNFNCRMCYVHLPNSEIEKHGKELTAEQWISLGEQAMKAGTLFLCITGGEPTMHPEFCKIYQNLSQMGFIITLQSNLYHFDEKCFELFEKYPPQDIKFTVYGAGDEIYEKVCGVNNGFTKVFKNIRRLKSAGIHLTAVTTLTKDNFIDMPEISALMSEMQIPWIPSSGLRKSLRGAESSVEELRIPQSEYKNICADAQRVMEKEVRKNALKPCEKCSEYRTGFWIKWDGKMSFCSFLQEPDISAASLGFDKAWKYLIEYEESLQWPKECKSCKWFKVCPRCAATLATESGSVNKINKDYCQYIDKIFSKIK